MRQESADHQRRMAALCPEASSPAQPRIFAVWTRELDQTENVGRVNVARQVRDALQLIAPVINLRLTNAFEDARPLRSILASATALLTGLLSGRPLALQCGLFAASVRRSTLLTELRTADVVYLDGIRTLLLLRCLRRANPMVRIIVDLDDLMSRRYETLSRERLPFSLGYLERMLPRLLSRLILARGFARLVLWYEQVSLRRADREILKLADAAVLLNGAEAAMLQAIGAGRGQSVRASVVAIPPMARQQNRTDPAAPVIADDWHAIFVGSDTLVQNRVAIAHLLELWSVYRLTTRLRIYGRQKGLWPSVPNVTFYGYVADVAEAYKPGSFLVYPCMVPGGIKTKILEAFSYGIPVIANSLAFEGILPPEYPLVIDNLPEFIKFLQNPASRATDLADAAQIGAAYLVQKHSPVSFFARWRAVVDG